jgi:sodium/bile acid cotransporter 7
MVLITKISKFLPDWFLTGMVAAIGLAWLFPAAGAEDGLLQRIHINQIGVALIFFLHGLTMSWGALAGGIRRWRAHVAVQATTFVIFPLFGLLFWRLTDGLVDPALQLGFFFLCALPSTVSSSVAMTAAARGDVPVAVFNASLSNLLGIIVTPLWIAAVAHQSAHSLPLGDTIANLCLWLLLPLLVGQLLHPLLGAWAFKHKRHIGKIDRLTILLLVYTSFCDSFTQQVWSGSQAQGMGTMLAALCLLLAVVIGGTWVACDKAKAAHALRSAIVFCASKKSLATGIPMAQVIFGGHPALALILLPIMIYHPLQLFVCGPLAAYWAREADKKGTI